jgi:iron complex outermembrane receptor protein
VRRRASCSSRRWRRQPCRRRASTRNAIVQAQDAFGITVGDEEIGLYSAGDARGFSPKDAGNLVIEGLYYDQQTYEPTARIIEGSVLRVGLSAQSYPLAAPTGIVDYQLRRPGRERITSISLGAGRTTTVTSKSIHSCHWLPR